MAIVSVRRLFPGRAASGSFTGKVTYKDVWEVIVDSPNDTEDDVGTAVDPNDGDIRIPVYGDSHPSNAGAVCVSVDPDQSDETWEHWFVTVSYDNQPSIPGGQQPTGTGALDGTPDAGHTAKDFPKNPFLRNPEWRLGSLDTTEPVEQWLTVDADGRYEFINPPAWLATTKYKRGKYVRNAGNVYYAVQKDEGTSGGGGGPVGKGDAEGRQVDGTVTWAYYATHAQTQNDPRFAILSPFVNSGRMPFDPPGMTDVSIPTIVVSKNIAVMDILYHMLIKNAVNLRQWGCIPARCAQVMKFESSYAEEGEWKFVKATWEIGLKPDTWDVRVLDAGYGVMSTQSVLNPDAPPARIDKKIFRRFKGPDGDDIGSAVPMNGRGMMLDPDDDPVYLRGIPRQMRIVDFNDLIPWKIPR